MVTDQLLTTPNYNIYNMHYLYVYNAYYIYHHKLHIFIYIYKITYQQMYSTYKTDGFWRNVVLAWHFEIHSVTAHLQVPSTTTTKNNYVWYI